MKKVKQLKRWEAMVCILLIPTVLLMVILLFFVPPVLEQYQWVRPEDEGKPMEAMTLMIVDGKQADTQYAVKDRYGEIVWLRRSAANQEYALTVDPNIKESGSMLTTTQAQTLVKPLWEFAASAGDWHLMTMGLITPRTVSMAVGKIKADATLSVSTGRLTMVEDRIVKGTDWGIISVSAVDAAMTQSFSVNVLLIP